MCIRDRCKEYLDNKDGLIVIFNYEVVPSKDNKDVGMKIIYESTDPFTNYLITLSYSEKKEDGQVEIHYACDRLLLDDLVVGIKRFTNESPNKKVGLILRDDFGLTLKKFDVSPGDMCVEENYCDDFKVISEKIVNTLNTDDNTGLVLLHGKPGSGKTTYIRHLSTLLDKDIMFVPNNMTDVLTSPEFIPFIMKYPNSVLIIEDAEKVIRSRDSGGDNAATSNILNMSDGILGECLKTQIIATFNTDRENIDKALLRKGRLIAEYEFNELSLNHFDLYRFTSSSEWFSSGFQDNINNCDVTLIEWPEIATEILPKPDLEIELLYENDGRIANIISFTKKGNKCLEHLHSQN